MRLLRSALVIALLAATLVFSLSPHAYASWDFFGGVDCTGEAANSAVCLDKEHPTDPLTGSDGIIIKSVNLVALVSGVAAVVMIILAALRMVTSGGSTEDIAGARRTLIYSVVGLVVIILSRTLVVLIIQKI